MFQFGALDFGSEAGSGAETWHRWNLLWTGPLTQALQPTQPSTKFRLIAVPTQQPQSSLFSKPGSVSCIRSQLPHHLYALQCHATSLSQCSRLHPRLQPLVQPVKVESSGPRSCHCISGSLEQRCHRPLLVDLLAWPPHPFPVVTPSHSTPIPSLSSHVTSTHSSGSALTTSSSLTISNEDSSSSGNLHGFSSSSSSQVVNPSPSVPLAVSSSTTNGLHPSGAPGLTPNGTNTTLSASGSRTAPLLTTTSGKAPPNLAQGVPPLLANQYIMGPGGLLPAYPQIYGYEDLQMLQSRLPMDYYGVTFPGTTAAMPGRDGLANNPYSGEATKFGRNDSSSPAPPTSLSTAGVQSQPQQAPQAGTQGQGTGQSQGQQTQNQAFLNPPLPPGYGYTGLPYYAGVPGVPSAFQYGPTVFVPPASAKQPAMGLANPSNQYHQQHQPSYGQHAYGTAPGLSGSGTSGGVPDMGGSIYSKTQSFDKQGFHTGTPPPFSLPSALGGTGPLNPGGAPGYAPAPFLHILPPHQQPHSQLLHHHLTQDGQ
ncbi:ubiquitin-associated protein 2-like isoform X3, partial [Lates japonicus]